LAFRYTAGDDLLCHGAILVDELPNLGGSATETLTRHGSGAVLQVGVDFSVAHGDDETTLPACLSIVRLSYADLDERCHGLYVSLNSDRSTGTVNFTRLTVGSGNW
jgi:hypothetical protein